MISWICFEWKTSGLPAAGDSVSPFVIRPAEKDEEENVGKMISSAFSMDPTWGDIARVLLENVASSLGTAFARPAPSCVVLLHGHRIIGASLLDTNPDSANHLLTGPCILHEYRNRGLGSGLLRDSLAFLGEHEVGTVRGITRDHSTAARFIYPKFGSSSKPCETDPLRPSEG